VERFGARRLALIAGALFVALATFHLLVTMLVGTHIVSFTLLMALTMGCFGLIGANLGSLAMQEMGHIAGTASAVQGMVGTVGAALIGLAIGQAFNGTLLPLMTGLALASALALLIIWLTDRGAIHTAPVRA
jgi:DHA1 family bicyclomycin/chloramphenicol resistance-like MFS transporter